MNADPITIDDIRRAGYCVSGARQWFKTHRLDFRAFLKDGASADILLATGDGLAERVVTHAQEARHG